MKNECWRSQYNIAGDPKKWIYCNPCVKKCILVLLSLSSSLATNADHFITGTDIPQHDQWCKDNCFDILTCQQRFQKNYIDLQIQTRHSIRDGPGQHLMYDGAFFGKTISRQSFDTQFVIDISETTLGISPCKVHILDVLSIRDDFEQVVVIFRLYDVLQDEIHELTRQIQNRTSLFYTGKVRDMIVTIVILIFDTLIIISLTTLCLHFWVL